jgi:hypothetical protein
MKVAARAVEATRKRRSGSRFTTESLEEMEGPARIDVRKVVGH